MLKKLRIKFVCIVMAIVTAMLVMILGVIVHYTKVDLQENSIQMMYVAAQRPFVPNRPNEVPQQIKLPYFIVQQGRDGTIITIGGEYFDLSDANFVQEIITIATESDELVGEIKQYNLRYCHIPMDNRIIFADISSEIATINNLIKICVVIGVLAFGVFLILSMLLSRWAIKPVEQAWLQQKQFVADASHELKTPLAVILTNAELLNSPDNTDEEKQQYANAVLTMGRHMRSLVEGLLQLARVENGNVQTAKTTLDYSALVEDALLPFEPMFFEKGKMLQSDILPQINITGSKEHLTQIVNILLDNALKYSTEGTQVNVKLYKQGAGCVLSVQSCGENISLQDLKNIFKRFYRTDKARSRDGSFGLGLAIAQGIVEEHSGKIWAESTNGKNTFYVQLPL